MARKSSRGTLVDYLVGAIEPALIIVMVGSMMFYLLDVWYQGPFLDRLRWILFWFVLGIVMITRVGMQIGGELAKGYGVALGGAVALVATVFAGFQPFLLAVMGLVWWATHKLTYDCTLTDENQDMGVGLLQESGLDPAPAPEAVEHHDPGAMESSLLPQRPWWKLWGRDPKDARQPHPPCLWLIYFSLAAIPAFSLGQWLVPEVEKERRIWLVVYFLAYLASAMGLLLATSFLNLRRYLRNRKVPMPGAMTAAWLSTGGFMIIGLTVAAAVLLPSLSGFRTGAASSIKSSNLRASGWAMLKDSGVQGKGAASEGEAASKSEGPQKESGEPEGSGKTNDPNAAQQTNGEGKAGGKKGPGRAKSGAPRGKASSGKGGASGKQGKGQDQSGDQGKKQDQSGDQGKSEDQSGDQQKNQDQGDAGKDGERDTDQGDEKGKSDSKDESSDQQDQGSSRSFQPPGLSLPSWVRTPVMIVGVLFLIFGAIRYGPEMLKGLWAMLAALFQGLWFGGPRAPRPKDDAEDPSAPEVPPRPFASFANPFDVGLDRQFTPDDLVLYSFEALEAWGYEQGLGRSPNETPTEFVRRVGASRPGLAADSARLATYFVAITYGRRSLKPEVLPQLRRFWHALEQGGAAVPAEHAAEV